MISKVPAERLRRVLPCTIDGSQMAFVEGWQIMDAILIANELGDDYITLKEGVVYYQS